MIRSQKPYIYIFYIYNLLTGCFPLERKNNAKETFSNNALGINFFGSLGGTNIPEFWNKPRFFMHNIVTHCHTQIFKRKRIPNHFPQELTQKWNPHLNAALNKNTRLPFRAHGKTQTPEGTFVPNIFQHRLCLLYQGSLYYQLKQGTSRHY